MGGNVDFMHKWDPVPGAVRMAKPIQTPWQTMRPKPRKYYWAPLSIWRIRETVATVPTGLSERNKATLNAVYCSSEREWINVCSGILKKKEINDRPRRHSGLLQSSNNILKSISTQARLKFCFRRNISLYCTYKFGTNETFRSSHLWPKHFRNKRTLTKM
jgi:hypothetical protein